MAAKKHNVNVHETLQSTDITERVFKKQPPAEAVCLSGYIEYYADTNFCTIATPEEIIKCESHGAKHITCADHIRVGEKWLVENGFISICGYQYRIIVPERLKSVNVVDYATLVPFGFNEGKPLIGQSLKSFYFLRSKMIGFRDKRWAKIIINVEREIKKEEKIHEKDKIQIAF